MTNVGKVALTNWSMCWIYTKEEWADFERWNAKRKGMFNYWWYALFHKNNQEIPSVQLTEQWVKIGDKRKYFAGPVTELRRVDISEHKQFNVMSITYEILSKGELNEIRLPVPKGKLKEAIDAQARLATGINIIL